MVHSLGYGGVEVYFGFVCLIESYRGCQEIRERCLSWNAKEVLLLIVLFLSWIVEYSRKIYYIVLV